MRVLWMSPWMRTLARVHVEALRELGAEVMLVTSDQHPESDTARSYERVVVPRPKAPSTWVDTARMLSEARAFRPDVVVDEIVRDPRWLPLGALAPRVTVLHDDAPHDDLERKRGWEQALFGRWTARAKITLAFSDYVAQQAKSGRVHGVSPVVRTVPLTSDLAQTSVPPLVAEADRTDFLVVGRLNEYKNIGGILDGWERHTAGADYRGDRLVLVGQGTVDRPLPDAVQWRNGPYSNDDMVPLLARAKGSLAYYRRASQSGVQVLSMQLGTTPIVSDQGALPEYQPANEPAVPLDRPDLLARAFDSLADPHEAARRGALSKAHYDSRFAESVVGRELWNVLSDAAGSTTVLDR